MNPIPQLSSNHQQIVGCPHPTLYEQYPAPPPYFRRSDLIFLHLVSFSFPRFRFFRQNHNCMLVHKRWTVEHKHLLQRYPYPPRTYRITAPSMNNDTTQHIQFLSTFTHAMQRRTRFSVQHIFSERGVWIFLGRAVAGLVHAGENLLFCLLTMRQCEGNVHLGDCFFLLYLILQAGWLSLMITYPAGRMMQWLLLVDR